VPTAIMTVLEANALALKSMASPAMMMDLCFMVVLLSFDLIDLFVCEGKRPFTPQGGKRRVKGTPFLASSRKSRAAS